MWSELKRLYGQQDVTLGKFNPISPLDAPLMADGQIWSGPSMLGMQLAVRMITVT
jgi:hypothetical protein